MPSLRMSILVGALFICAIGHGADERQPVAPPLVTKDRVQLNLAGAELVLSAAKQKAVAMGWKMNLAVVDDGGHLLAFARMDGARPASATTALTKAVSAATFRQESGALPLNGEPDLLLNLSLQHASSISGGKITSLKGGIPIVIDGQIVGAIGIGGGTGDQDAEAAKAGVQALIAELAKTK
jgi:glc operon protein GlcG